MSDNKRPLPDTELKEEKPTQTVDIPRAKNGRSAFIYLIVLVGAAFLLLLFAYLMQQRNSEEIMGNLNDLRESMGAFGSMDQLLDENQELREENELLQARIGELQDEIDRLDDVHREFQVSIEELKDSLSQLELTAQQTGQAMDLFWRLNEAYVLNQYALCRELIGQLEEADTGEAALKEFLPTEADGGNSVSPAQRYQEIYDALY